MAADRDEQRRELEEIRRKFTEMGARVGSLFEPGPDDDHDTRDAAPATPPTPAAAPAPAAGPAVSRMAAVAAVVVALLAGVGLGYLLPRADAGNPSTAAPAPATSSPAAGASSRSPQARIVARVPPACLEAARKGDLTIHYYTINVRDRRLVQALKAYTLASQACRREASP